MTLGKLQLTEKGCVTEDEMDGLEIINVNKLNSKPKDQRALHQQRAVIMNSEDCIAKFKIYKTEKQLEEDRKAAMKALAIAKRAEKEAEAAERQQYKAWFNTLSDKDRKYRRSEQ